MKHGDLSSEVVPRLVLVFEHALAFIGGDEWKAFQRDLKRHRWDQAADQWDINPLMAAKIWDVTKRQSFQLDIVTFLSQEKQFEYALEHRLTEVEELPIHRVMAWTEDKLAQRIAYMPDLARIYDPDQRRALRWGSKGRFISDVNQLGL